MITVQTGQDTILLLTVSPIENHQPELQRDTGWRLS